MMEPAKSDSVSEEGRVTIHARENRARLLDCRRHLADPFSEASRRRRKSGSFCEVRVVFSARDSRGLADDPSDLRICRRRLARVGEWHRKTTQTYDFLPFSAPRIDTSAQSVRAHGHGQDQGRGDATLEAMTGAPATVGTARHCRHACRIPIAVAAYWYSGHLSGHIAALRRPRVQGGMRRERGTHLVGGP